MYFDLYPFQACDHTGRPLFNKLRKQEVTEFGLNCLTVLGNPLKLKVLHMLTPLAIWKTRASFFPLQKHIQMREKKHFVYIRISIKHLS